MFFTTFRVFTVGKLDELWLLREIASHVMHFNASEEVECSFFAL